MQFLEEQPTIDLRLIVPPHLAKEGYFFQEAFGREKVLITHSLEFFYESVHANVPNAWVADDEFLTQPNMGENTVLKSLPLVYLRNPALPIPVNILNEWCPVAFWDKPLASCAFSKVYDNLLEALHVNEERRLFDALKGNLKEDGSKHIVLDMDHAFDKEISIIRNDIYYQQLDNHHSSHQKIRLDMFYKPMELLSGDSYSVRKIAERYIVCFLIDAMSKGVAAALTSISSTSVLNYLIDRMLENDSFDLTRLIQEYVKFIKTELMDDEIVSAFFVAFDRKERVMEYAMFGMPPFLVGDEQDQIVLIKSNNMPIFPYTDEFKVSKTPMSSFHKLLMASDGLCESELEDGRLYRTELADDFLRSANISTFIALMKQKIGKGNDDIAFFYIEKVDTSVGEQQNMRLLSTRESIEDALYKVAPFLEKHQTSPKIVAEISLTLTELLTNALEHGSFGLSREEKHRLIQQDTFELTIEKMEEEKSHSPIDFNQRIYEKEGLIIYEATIKDEGAGFDTKLLKNLIINTENFNGRGFMIIKKLVDRFYFNEKGNEITIVKFLR